MFFCRWHSQSCLCGPFGGIRAPHGWRLAGRRRHIGSGPLAGSHEPDFRPRTSDTSDRKLSIISQHAERTNWTHRTNQCRIPRLSSKLLRQPRVLSSSRAPQSPLGLRHGLEKGRRLSRPPPAKKASPGAESDRQGTFTDQRWTTIYQPRVHLHNVGTRLQKLQHVLRARYPAASHDQIVLADDLPE